MGKKMSFRTINDTIIAEIIIKKSRFICIVMPVNHMQDIDTGRDKVSQKYPGANHYCFAYRLRQDGSILERCSDDGEPSGTAGWPMLNVLAQNNLENIMAIVVRYFGGTLFPDSCLSFIISGSLRFLKSCLVSWVHYIIYTQYHPRDNPREEERIRDIDLLFRSRKSELVFPGYAYLKENWI